MRKLFQLGKGLGIRNIFPERADTRENEHGALDAKVKAGRRSCASFIF